MRNLKRALSLALASVMLLGMMVVGTSAASYPDVDESKHHVEAIDVLNAVEVMIGDAGTGNFRPDDKVSRNEMAVIMAKLVLGTYEADSYAGAHPFTDVPEWADRYVAACYTNGIIAGRSADTYDGSATVTAVEAAAMMLRALGYEDLSLGAAQWDQPVAAKANEVELFKGMSGNSKAEMSRDAVAQLSLNALKTTMVTTSKGTDITMSDGTTFYAARSYNKVTSSADWATAIDNFEDEQGRSYVELGEKLYDGKLTLNDGTDSFGRPCAEWEYKGRTVTAAEDYNVIFTADTSKGDVEKALKNYKIVTTKAEGETKKVTKGMTDTGVVSADSIQTINGASATAFNSGAKSAAEAISDLTGDGKAVEIYANGSREITKIVVLTYGVSTINNVTESKDGDYTKTNYTLSGGFRGGYAYTDPDKDSKVVVHGDVERDDTVIVLELADETHVWPAETMTGEQTSYNSGKNTITVDGKTYTVAVDMARSSVDMDDFETNTDGDATFYLDLYGNVVKSEAISSKDYAVIDSIKWSTDSGSLDTGKVIARLIFTDGTTKDVTLNKLTAKGDGATAQGFDPSANDTTAGVVSTGANKSTVCTDMDYNTAYVGLIVTYAEKSNGKYDVVVKSDAATTVTGDGTTAQVTNGVPGMAASISGNSKTVYIVRSDDDGDYEYDVYTGYENVPTIKVANTVAVTVSHVDKNGFAEYVFISAPKAGVDTDKSTDLVYIFDQADMSQDKDDNFVFNKAALNGEAQAVTAETDAFAADGLYEVKVNSDGVVTSAKAISHGHVGVDPDAKWVVGTVIDGDAKDGTVKVGANSYNYLTAKDKTYGITTDDTISPVTGEYARSGYQVYLKLKSATDDKEKFQIDTMYIVETENAAQILPSAPDKTEIEDTLRSEGTAQLPDGGTVPANTEIKDGQTLVLTGNATVGANTTVKAGGKIEVNGTVSGGTIATEAGGTVEIKGDVEMPKVSGNGTVEVPSGVTAGAVGSATTAEQYIADLKNKGLTSDTTKTGSASTTGDAITYTVSAANTVGVMGEGKVESWSSEVTIAQAAARTGGNASSKVIFVQLNLEDFTDQANQYVKIEYKIGDGAATPYGTATSHNHLKVADIKDGISNTCTIPVTSNVTAVILTLVAA